MAKLDDNKWEAFKRNCRKRREIGKRILRRICLALGIEEDVGNLYLDPVRKYDDLFPGVSICCVFGSGFERPVLPDGSFMFVAITHSDTMPKIVELTPRNCSLSNLLADNFEILENVSPVLLADLVLMSQTVGTVNHEVLSDLNDLTQQTRQDRGFVLTDETRNIVSRDELPTSMRAQPNVKTIQALTLYGWMHEKQNLGLTEIEITQNEIRLGERKTVCEPVFQETPSIWY